MALPTKIDPMLGYLTTGYQDHVRLREKFGCRVNDRMQGFFVELQVLDVQGRPAGRFGDPLWVWLQYCQRKGDRRPETEIMDEGRRKMSEVRGRGVFLASGSGAKSWDLAPQTDREIRRIYSDAKQSIWTELTPAFVAAVPQGVTLATRSADRTDYILHPASGEALSGESARKVRELRELHAGRFDVQIVVSDGLNALSIMDEGHLDPFLERLRGRLAEQGCRAAPEVLVMTSGRVRAGYRIGETLFQGREGRCTLVHVIGERPGTGHHTFSVYLTATDGAVWSSPGAVDHNLTKVVSGIATTALAPQLGAEETVRILAALKA
jgi:ethanolamine ammonia-lyase large subunit